MKKTILMGAVALAVSFVSISCKKKVSDADLQTQATTIVTSNPNASVEVKDGVAHLSGTFANQQAKDAMITQLKAVNGIKDVMDMSVLEEPSVTPSVTTTTVVDPVVQQKVKDAVKDFPGVTVEVVNNELTLKGNVSPDQARKIKESVDALKIGKYNNNLVVK